MADKTTHRFGCPTCKGDNIVENNIVEVQLPVLEWDEDGEPTGFGEWQTVDGTIRTLDPDREGPRWHCRDCCKDFAAVIPVLGDGPNPANHGDEGDAGDESDIPSRITDPDQRDICDPIAEQRMDAADVKAAFENGV